MTSGPSDTSDAGGGGHHDHLLAQAMLALNSERPADAERMAAEVLKADPRRATALYILGRALTMQGRVAEAIAPLEAAAGRGDPEFDRILAVAFNELGYQLVLMNRYDEAVDVLNLGLRIAPMMPELSIQLGYAQLSRSDCASAKVAFARALDISPRAHDALFGMAKAYQELGDNEEAAAHFRNYLTDRPNDFGAWLNLGHCLLELGQPDAGYECFRRAVRGDAHRYSAALTSLAAAARGRFWLRPSAAARFFRSSQQD